MMSSENLRSTRFFASFPNTFPFLPLQKKRGGNTTPPISLLNLANRRKPDPKSPTQSPLKKRKQKRKQSCISFYFSFSLQSPSRSASLLQATRSASPRCRCLPSTPASIPHTGDWIPSPSSAASRTCLSAPCTRSMSSAAPTRLLLLAQRHRVDLYRSLAPLDPAAWLDRRHLRGLLIGRRPPHPQGKLRRGVPAGADG